MATIGRFTLDTKPLSEEVQAIAARELRETPEIREAALVELRTLLQNTPDLQYADDDYYLLIFLRPTHFYAESALKLVSADIVPQFICIYHSYKRYASMKTSINL